MLFLIIPLSLIGVSLLAIGVIVWRKVPYMRRLTPEAHGLNQSVFTSFFPELVQNFGPARIKEYFAIWLQEMEKLLRKMRLLFSFVDRMSDNLIKRIRSAQQKRAKQTPTVPAPKEPEQPKVPEYVDVPTVQVRPRRTAPNPALLKSDEQRLIVEIAHDPKNARLYRELGEVYIKMKNYEDAKESFATALKLNPADDVSQRKLALVLQKLEPVDGSIEIEK